MEPPEINIIEIYYRKPYEGSELQATYICRESIEEIYKRYNISEEWIDNVTQWGLLKLLKKFDEDEKLKRVELNRRTVIVAGVKYSSNWENIDKR